MSHAIRTGINKKAYGIVKNARKERLRDQYRLIDGESGVEAKR